MSQRKQPKRPGGSQHNHNQTTRSHQESRQSSRNQREPQHASKRPHNSHHHHVLAGHNSNADTTSFFDLPEEVQLMIGHSLTQHQLTVSVRVCRAWGALYKPILWKHVEDSASRRTRHWAAGRDDALLACIGRSILKTHCRMIHSLRLELSNVDFADLQARRQLPSTFPQLTSVELIGVSGSDNDIANFLRRGSPAGWKRIVFRTNHPEVSSRFGNESAKEVLKHAATLEVLRVEGAWCLSSTEIQKLLCGLPKLKEFFVLGSAQLYVPPDPSLKASDLVASRWVCTNLEVFGRSIGEVPRAKPKTKDHQKSINLQRQVCAQLGRFHKLRELILKAPYPIYDAHDPRRFNEHESHSCLAWSLESGLDLLRNLKDLRKVGLEDMDVDIGNPAEQAWVKKHWPHATVWFPKNPEPSPRISIYGNHDDDDDDDYNSGLDSNDSNIPIRQRIIAAIEDDYYVADEYDPDWEADDYYDKYGLYGVRVVFFLLCAI